MKPLVTIAIPTYKRLPYLIEAVESALQQTYTEIEVLVGVDPSESGADKAIVDWCTKKKQVEPKFKYFINSQNLGLAGNWNACVEKAVGEYMIIIGDDDRLLPECVESLLVGISEGAQISFSNHYLIDESGIRLSISEENTKRFNRHDLNEGFLMDSEKTIWKNAIPISASLIETKLLRLLHFKNDLNTPEIEFYLRASALNKTFYFTPKYLAEYRVHNQSATSMGLKVHKLFNYLVNIEVSKSNYAFKKEFLQTLSIVSINNFIKEKNVKMAKHIFNSDYYIYSNQFAIKKIIHKILLAMPSSVSSYILLKK